ncbi:MAG: sigma-70 family RNA polymerase sigma factor [Bacteroidales bacterium]|nr:sigma-70 family RNA polymerase sigma factor [Bacteroidales bacterium]
MHSDDDIIIGIQNNHEWAVSIIYKTQYASIKNMVYSFRNTTLEPEDIFQEGLTRIVLSIRKGNFRGESSLATYLNSVCRNICLKILAKPNPVVTEQIIVQMEAENDNYYELLAFVSKLKKEMGDGCREIIDLRFKQSEETEKISNTDNKLHGFDEIAQRLDITVDNARQRFKRCLDQLRKMVLTHPEYQTLFD